MKKFLFIVPFLLCSCTPNTVGDNDYGAFLGRSENNTSGFSSYKYLSFEFDEFSIANITSLNNQGIKTFAYLNVGSLENYRSYYNQFANLTFLDYEDWPDERWIDVSNQSWQTYIIDTLAVSFKQKGAYGVYMDNVDVYTIAKEESHNVSGIKQGLKNIIKSVNDLGLKVMINGGSEFLDDMNDEEDTIFNSIYAYHQEEVFSLIDDYDNDIFVAQNSEDKNYYQEIATMMKNKGKEIFFLEYTKDETLINTIKNYCNSKKYHYYISSTVDLI